MAYTNVWADTTPLGSTAANLIDDLFRSLVRVDIVERLNTVLGTGTSWAALDPIVATKLSFGVTASPKIIGGATDLHIRNNADNADNIIILDNGTVQFNNQITVKSNIVADRTGLAADVNFVSRGDAGKNRGLIFGTGSLTRWFIAANTTAESGSNAGSDFIIQRYDDTGVSLGTVVSISRNLGQITFTGPGTQTTVLNTTSGLTTDATQICFQRGGSNKWRIGTNINGTNSDEFNVYGGDILGGTVAPIRIINSGRVLIGSGVAGTPTLDVDANNAAGAQQVQRFLRQGILKWQFGYDAGDNFTMFDSSSNPKYIFAAAGQLNILAPTGTPGLVIDRNDTPALNTIICLSRAGSIRARIGLTSTDLQCFTDSTGGTVYANVTTDGINARNGFTVGGAAPSGHYLRGDGTKYIDSALLASDLSGQDCVRVYRSSDFTLAAAYAAIGFDTEDYDTNNLHDNVTNNSRLTAQSSGKYKITAHLDFQGTANPVAVSIRKNGVATDLAVSFREVTGSSTESVEINVTLSLSATDYVEVLAKGGVGQLVLHGTAGESTYFEMQKITS